MKLKPILAIVSGLIAIQSMPSQAADSVELDEVSVTATRSAEKISEQPLSIAKKGAEEKRLDQAVFQKDVLNSIAGVYVNQTGSVLGHKIAVRMHNSTDPYYLYLQDNIPVQSSGFFNHNAMAYTNFQTAESAEVLKGAGTALYGSDSVAATINIQSPKPAEELERKVTVYGGSDGFKQGGFSVSDTQDDGSSYLLSGSATQSDGWQDHTETKRHEINAQYNFSKADDDFKLAFVSSHSKAQQAGSLDSLEALEETPELAGDEDYIANLDQVDAMRQFDHNRLSVQWDSYRLDNVDLSTIFYLRNTRNQYTATWENNLPHNDSEENTFGIMHKGIYEPSWGRLIYGVDTEITKGDKTYIQEFDYVPSGWGSSVDAGTIYDYSIDYFALSPYIHSDWNVAENTVLAAGLRYDMNRYEYTNNTDDGIYGSSAYFRVSDRNDSYNHLSPKLSLTHKLQPNEMVYARYANGFRVPSASRLYSPTKTDYDFTLDPEVSNTYEIGYKFDGQSTDAEIAVYYMDLADTITRYTDDDGNRYYDNGGVTTHKGIEVSFKQELTPELSAKVAYSLSKHNFSNDEVYGNDEMAEAPNHQLNLRAFYKPSSVEGLLVMVEGIYTSDYWMDHDHTMKYAGYKVANLKADYQVNKQWRVFAKVNNLTDERYAESATYAYGSENYTPAAPRQYFIGTELKW